MKRFCLLFCLLASIPLFAASPRNPVADGTCKGIKLYGTVRVVNRAWADFTVRVTDRAWADLDVEAVNGTPSKCGEWRFVTSGTADFTIRYTTRSDADFTIRFVTAFPGIR